MDYRCNCCLLQSASEVLKKSLDLKRHLITSSRVKSSLSSPPTFLNKILRMQNAERLSDYYTIYVSFVHSPTIEILLQFGKL
jgi:hypothetical protein